MFLCFPCCSLPSSPLVPPLSLSPFLPHYLLLIPPSTPGLDHGRVTIIHIAEDVNGTVRSYKLSRSHYYRNSGIMRSRRLTETWI